MPMIYHLDNDSLKPAHYDITEIFKYARHLVREHSASFSQIIHIIHHDYDVIGRKRKDNETSQ